MENDFHNNFYTQVTPKSTRTDQTANEQTLEAEAAVAKQVSNPYVSLYLGVSEHKELGLILSERSFQNKGDIKNDPKK